MNGKTLLFEVKKGTDTSVWWRGIVRIKCHKVWSLTYVVLYNLLCCLVYFVFLSWLSGRNADWFSFSHISFSLSSCLQGPWRFMCIWQYPCYFAMSFCKNPGDHYSWHAIGYHRCREMKFLNPRCFYDGTSVDLIWYFAFNMLICFIISKIPPPFSLWIKWYCCDIMRWSVIIAALVDLRK